MANQSSDPNAWVLTFTPLSRDRYRCNIPGKRPKIVKKGALERTRTAYFNQQHPRTRPAAVQEYEKPPSRAYTRRNVLWGGD